MAIPDLRHVYGSVAELNDTLVRGGATVLTDPGNNARKLKMLDEVSRLIDQKAHRGTGFGPWVGTRQYDGDGRNVLFLRADLLDLDDISVRASQSSDAVEPVVETDFYLSGLGTYESPFRMVILHGQGTPTTFGQGYRTVEITGTWSYPFGTHLLAATLDDALTDSSETAAVTALTEFSAGQTLLIDDEQMHVTATTAGDPDTITIERGVNGTTAASHLDEAPIRRYRYNSSVHTLCLRLAEKRWKARDAGADGNDGGGDVGSISLREGEDTIIRRMLGPVRLVGVV